MKQSAQSYFKLCRMESSQRDENEMKKDQVRMVLNFFTLRIGRFSVTQGVMLERQLLDQQALIQAKTRLKVK